MFLYQNKTLKLNIHQKDTFVFYETYQILLQLVIGFLLYLLCWRDSDSTVCTLVSSQTYLIIYATWEKFQMFFNLLQ